MKKKKKMKEKKNRKKRVGDRLVLLMLVEVPLKAVCSVQHSPITLLIHRERIEWKILLQFESGLNLTQDEIIA